MQAPSFSSHLSPGPCRLLQSLPSFEGFLQKAGRIWAHCLLCVKKAVGASREVGVLELRKPPVEGWVCGKMSSQNPSPEVAESDSPWPARGACAPHPETEGAVPAPVPCISFRLPLDCSVHLCLPFWELLGEGGKPRSKTWRFRGFIHENVYGHSARCCLLVAEGSSAMLCVPRTP